MTKPYSNHYNDFNSHCHICQKETNIWNNGGGNLIFRCPDNDFRDRSKSIHWFEIMENHFISGLNSKVISITLSLPNDYVTEFVYENHSNTNWKTIQLNYIFFKKLKPFSSLSFSSEDKFSKIEYTKNYKELISRVMPRIEKLMIFL